MKIYTCSPLRHAEMHFLAPIYPQRHRSRNPQNPKHPNIPKSKNPQIQESKSKKLQNSENPEKGTKADFVWILDCWNFGFLDSGSLDLWISGRQELYYRAPQIPVLHNPTICVCTIYIYASMCMNTHHWLNHAFAVAKGYLANLIMVHCLHKY